MKIKSVLLAIICFSFLCSCSQPAIYSKTKIESTLYDQETIKLDGQRELNILCDYGNIEIYNWDKQEVKFEMKKRVRGVEEKDKLNEKLKDFSIDITEERTSIQFKSQYKGSIKGSEDKILDLRIYAPKNISIITLKMVKGYFKLLDDMKCSLKVEAKVAHIDLNRIIGAVKLNIETGNVKLNNGKITGESEIRIGTGNIYVKSLYDKNIKCTYETKTGNIELFLPTDFNSGIELYGTIEKNEFPNLKADKGFLVKSDIGKISLRKFR